MVSNSYAPLFHVKNKHLDKMGIDARKPVFGFVNSKGAGQPAHPRSLISAVVFLLLESIISKHATTITFYFLASLCS